MTDKSRELLERVLAGMDRYGDIYPETLEEIRAYLAEPEVKREALSEDEIDAAQLKYEEQFGPESRHCFTYAVRFAEKHHGIGGGDD